MSPFQQPSPGLPPLRASATTASSKTTGGLLSALLRNMPLAAAFSVAVAAATVLIAAVSLYMREVGWGARTTELLVTYGEGSLIGGFLAWLVAVFVAGNRPATSRFAAMLITLSFGVAGGITLIYLIRFRVYYAAAHDNFPSFEWLIQLVFSGASVVYTFIVSGLPLLLPAGLIPLFIGSAIFARRPRG